MGKSVIIRPMNRLLFEFSVPGLVQKTEKFGSGIINDTYLCTFLDSGTIRSYILQRINASVFKQPEKVMANVCLVTGHIQERLRAQGVPDPSAVTPSLVYTRAGGSHFRDEEGAFWRMYHFIESGRVYDAVRDSGHAFEIGRGIGRFQALVADLAPDSLFDTLPGFHHTPKYLQEFDAAFQKDAAGRAAEIMPEAEFIAKRRGLAPLLMDSVKTGALPVRVVHNDPKVNNIMIDTTTGKALCMLDLDTVKPGLAHFDFGDCVRSAANPEGEDGELRDIRFDLDLFKAVSGGYLGEAAEFLTADEVRMLPVSVKVITFELGMRFLADYLRGDTYFKTAHSGHNLHRARVQFRLLELIEAVEKQMASFIADCSRIS
jgi:Ser/Thr protein kinase RdoA (MazF antagonist)